MHRETCRNYFSFEYILIDREWWFGGLIRLNNFSWKNSFKKSRVEFWKRIIIILCNLYFVVALKCIDAKSTGVPNWLFPSNCIAHSNQSTIPSLIFAIYQNVFEEKPVHCDRVDGFDHVAKINWFLLFSELKNTFTKQGNL